MARQTLNCSFLCYFRIFGRIKCSEMCKSAYEKWQVINQLYKDSKFIGIGPGSAELWPGEWWKTRKLCTDVIWCIYKISSWCKNCFLCFLGCSIRWLQKNFGLNHNRLLITTTSEPIFMNSPGHTGPQKARIEKIMPDSDSTQKTTPKNHNFTFLKNKKFLAPKN